MDGVDADALPVGVVRLDRLDRVLGVNTWFRGWIGEDVVGRRIDDVLEPVPDFLDGPRSAVLMSPPGDPDRAVFVVHADTAEGRLLTVVDAADRYADGRRLRRSQDLSSRTQNRLQLIMDASIAFAAAQTETRLAEILAVSAAQAYQSEEAAVFLYGDDGVLRRAAGTNPLATLIDDASVSVAARQFRHPVKVSGKAEASRLAPALAAAMGEVGVHAILAAPLHLDGKNLGVFVCFFLHLREFDDEASPLAEALAGQAAQKLATLTLQRRLQHAAMHDETTNLPNRRRLDDLAPQGDQAHVSVIFIDLDGFKDVNDRLGHEVGDDVLREVARRLQAGVRDADVVARYGGDEFVVVCDADGGGALEIAERLRSALSAPYDFLSEPLPIGASVGVATGVVSHGVLSIDRLIRDADQAMYLAKGRGGNQVANAGFAVRGA